MAEPPTKRARRMDSAAMWDHEATSSPKSPRPSDSRKGDRGRSRYDDDDGSHKPRRQNDKRRSQSPRDKVKSEVRRSRSRDRHDRDRDRDRDRNRDLDRNRYRERERERSADRSERDRRDYERERVRDKDSKHRSQRQRSRSPARNGTDRAPRGSPARDSRTNHDRPSEVKAEQPLKKEPEDKPKTNGDSKMDIDEDDEDARLRRAMGFTTFKTTQNKKVPGNQIYAVRKEKKTVYRQYMNRVGGFNRPLSPGR